MLKKLLLLVRVSRPLSWLLVALLYAIGIAISHAQPTAAVVANAILLVFLLSLIVFGVNDIYDCLADSINKRKRSIVHGTALGNEHHNFVMAAAIVSSVGIAVFSLSTRNPTNMAATAIALTAAWAYSVPPFRLKEIPILDSLSNAVLIWAVILVGFSYGAPLGVFPKTVYFAAFGASAVHAIGAVMDYSSDKKAGARTIATFFGKRFAAVFSFAVMMLILFFSGIKSLPLRVIVWYILLSSLLLAFKDDERLAKSFFTVGFVVTAVAIAVYVIPAIL